MKECSGPLVIRETQIKTTVKFHLIPVRMAVLSPTPPPKKTNIGDDVGKDYSNPLLVEM